MPDLLLLLACPLGALAIAGFLRRRRMLADPGVGTAAEFLAPLLLGLLVYAYAHTLELNTRWPWSAARLAPTLGLVHGYPLYSAPDAGPINGWLYGPVAALAWLPAALADSPRPALAIAAAINLLLLLGPLLFLCLRGGAAPRPARLLAFAAVAGAFLLAYPTWYMASVLCSDAVAGGLGLVPPPPRAHGPGTADPRRRRAPRRPGRVDEADRGAPGPGPAGLAPLCGRRPGGRPLRRALRRGGPRRLRPLPRRLQRP